jgi:hypothetical protein
MNRLRQEPGTRVQGIPPYSPGSETRVRLAAYRFGEHMRSGDVGKGRLLLISPTASWGTVKRLIIQALYGTGVDFSRVDEVGTHVYLLPHGEEIMSTGTRGRGTGRGRWRGGEVRRGGRRGGAQTCW